MKYSIVLFIALLPFSVASGAMENSAGLAQAHNIEPIDRTQHSTISIDPEAACAVCLEKAKDSDPHQLRATSCCGNFICLNDANEIKNEAEKTAANFQTAQQRDNFIQQRGFAPRSLLKSLCPFCRKDLKIIKAAIQSEMKVDSLEIIDGNGQKFNLPSALANALLTCTAFEMYKEYPGTLDFSQLSVKRDFLTKETIAALASLIKQPHTIDSISKDIDLLQAADHLGAPDNILYLLVNELWPALQEQTHDSQHVKASKKHLRKVAQSYLSSPCYLLDYLQTKSEDTQKDFRAHCVHEKDINLSWNAIKEFSDTLQDKGWYIHNKAPMRLYPFHSLDGIEKLLDYLNIDKEWQTWSLNLKNHAIETFSCTTDMRIHTIDVSHNKITQLIGKEEGYLPAQINLNNNPIRSIEESFFTMIRAKRATGYINVGISLENNFLSSQQKKEVENKFYKATHTLPERYCNEKTFKGAIALAGGLLGAMCSSAGAYYISKNSPQNTFSFSLAVVTAALVGTTAYLNNLPLLISAGAGFLGRKFLDYHENKWYQTFPSWLVKAIPMATAAPFGGFLGANIGFATSNTLANCLAKISHPKIKLLEIVHAWENGQSWRHGNPTIKL